MSNTQTNSTQQLQLSHSDEKTVKYAILMETNAEEAESWYYFIKYQGNEQELRHISETFDDIDWRIIDDDVSIFDIDIHNLVSEQTAREMIRVNVNHYMSHRKFDGKLRHIDFGKTSHRNSKLIRNVFRKLGYGKIDKFIDQEEEYDDPDVTDGESETDSESEYSSDPGAEATSGTESETEADSESDYSPKFSPRSSPERSPVNLPKSIINSLRK